MMTRKMAEEILGVPRRFMWDEFVYTFINKESKVRLKGKFTSDELFAIAYCMRNKIANYITLDEDGRFLIKLFGA